MAQGKPLVPVRRLDYLAVALFVLLWLLPVVFAGATYTAVRFFPDALRYQTRIACLFHSSTRYWSNYYVQVRLGGDDTWITPPQRDFSRMNPVGHRSRIAWAIARSNDDPRGELQRQAIADFVRGRFEALYPEAGSVEGVRYLRILYETGEDGMARPDGAWATPPLAQVEPGRGIVTSTHTFEPQ